MKLMKQGLVVAVTAGVAMASLGCGAASSLFGRGQGWVPRALAEGERREIPVSTGVPPLGQQPILPRDPALDAGKVPLSLLYTNDIHSRVDPFPVNFYYGFYAAKGGMARLATAIKDLKAKQPNTLAVDSGDYLQGTPYFNFFKGETEMKLMQALGFDAITIGNHEFDNGVDDLMKVLPHYKGKLITTNMTFTPEVAQRYSVIKVGQVRVGLFALITEVNGLVSAPNFKGAKYYDPIACAKAAVAKLKQESDVVVLLSHMGTVPPYSEEGGDDHEAGPITDEVLAAKVPGIDVIISGHTHVMIKRPKLIRHNNASPTYIVSSGMGGGYLGKADLTLERGKTVALANDCLPLTNAVPAHPAIEAMIAPYRATMDRSIKVELGEATGQFKRYGAKDMESSLNNLISDACLAAARSIKPETAFAVTSSGTPRNPISQGKILVEDVFYALPFDNQLVLMEVNGKTALEMLTIQRRPTDRKRHAIANVTYTLTANNGPITDVRIGGKPLDPNGKYWVAVNDYMADGSSGFTMLPGNPRLDTKVLQRDALINFIRAKRTITPELGRIKYTGN